MAFKMDYKYATATRDKMVHSQQVKVLQAYQRALKEARREINKLGKNNLRAMHLQQIQHMLVNRIRQYNRDIRLDVVRAGKTVVDAVIQDKKSYMRQMGFRNLGSYFTETPDRVMQELMSGRIYANIEKMQHITFDDRLEIWTRCYGEDVSSLIAAGTAQGKSAYEIAKEIDKYTDDKTMSRRVYWKDEHGNPHSFYFGNVTRRAQMLARTTVSQAYQRAFVAVNENDPFVESFEWRSSGLHGRMCKVCEERNGQIFPKDKLPLDHPNGMCTYIAVQKGSLNDIANTIADWYNSPWGTYPEIDKFAELN